MSKQFFTDGMTVNDILNIPPDVLSKLNKRDISRALRTVSLAANKRIERLKRQSKKTREGYKPKTTGRNIATDALNWVTDDGHKRTKFGVKKSSTRNEMIAQLTKAKKFMSMKSSTVTGAVNVRKERERRLFGKTREQAARSQKTKKGKDIIAQMFEQKMSDAWSYYRKFLEIQGRDPHSYYEGSETIIDLVGNKVLSGADEGEVLNAALEKVREMYDTQQAEYNDIFNDDDFWEL